MIASGAQDIRRRPRATELHEMFARRGIDFGFAIGLDTITTHPSIEPAIVERESNVSTDGYSQIMGLVNPTEGAWSWTNAHTVHDWITSRGMEHHAGGHLIWHEVQPSWFTSLTNPTTIRSKVREFIDRSIDEFPNVKSWTVVNEPIEPWNGNPFGWRSCQMYTAFGANWPTEFFTYARTLTDAELIWNDYVVENWVEGFDATKAALIVALDAGAPIDTFGMQLHASASMPSGAVLADRLNQIADLGLSIRLTEVDLHDSGTAWPIATRRADQAAWMLDRLGTIVAEVPALKSVTMWSITDRSSWLNDVDSRTDGLKGEYAPFDRAGWLKTEWWQMFNTVTAPG